MPSTSPRCRRFAGVRVVGPRVGRAPVLPAPPPITHRAAPASTRAQIHYSDCLHYSYEEEEEEEGDDEGAAIVARSRGGKAAPCCPVA
jgi:hypothetical protein